VTSRTVEANKNPNVNARPVWILPSAVRALLISWKLLKLKRHGSVGGQDCAEAGESWMSAGAIGLISEFVEWVAAKVSGEIRAGDAGT